MTESFQKDLDTCSWTVGRPPPVHSCSCTRVSLCRAREGRRFGFAGRGSGPARRCRGGELLGPGSRFPRAEPRWALRANLSSGSRGSGGSSRRRRARRGPGGCRRTAAVPGPPPHDRSAASGSRAPLMPCRGSWRVKGLGSGRGRGFLSSDAGTNWVPRWAQITAVAPRISLPPGIAVAPAFQKWLGVAGALHAWCLLY